MSPPPLHQLPRSDGWQEASIILKGFYVDFYVTMKAYDRKKVEEANALCVSDREDALEEIEQRDQTPKKGRLV